MKNFKKVAIVLMVLVLSTAMVLCALACSNKPAEEGETFTLEVRKFNGANALGVVNVDGELLASKTITVKEGQTTVADALAEVAPLADGAHKITFDGNDYLLFSEGWFLTDGSLSKEKAYIAADYQWSYMACDGVMSNGATQDAVAGLKVYTIVIDGWDGNIGQ